MEAEVGQAGRSPVRTVEQHAVDFRLEPALLGDLVFEGRGFVPVLGRGGGFGAQGAGFWGTLELGRHIITIIPEGTIKLTTCSYNFIMD